MCIQLHRSRRITQNMTESVKNTALCLRNRDDVLTNAAVVGTLEINTKQNNPFKHVCGTSLIYSWLHKTVDRHQEGSLTDLSRAEVM